MKTGIPENRTILCESGFISATVCQVSVQVRERRGGTLPGALEQGWEGAQMERHPLLLRDLLRLRTVTL